MESEALLQQRLWATSNVIELKAGHQYLLVFAGEDIEKEEAGAILEHLYALGIESLIVTVRDRETLQVIEVPPAPEREAAQKGEDDAEDPHTVPAQP